LFHGAGKLAIRPLKRSSPFNPPALYGQDPKRNLRADWLKAIRIFERALRTRKAFCQKHFRV
jgi:hypothetical protein